MGRVHGGPGHHETGMGETSIKLEARSRDILVQLCEDVNTSYMIGVCVLFDEHLHAPSWQHHDPLASWLTSVGNHTSTPCFVVHEIIEQIFNTTHCVHRKKKK